MPGSGEGALAELSDARILYSSREHMSKNNRIPARTVLTDPVNFLAFGFGTGLAPVAPGTFGSLPGVLLFWLTLDFGLYVQLGIAAGLAVAVLLYFVGELAQENIDDMGSPETLSRPIDSR